MMDYLGNNYAVTTLEIKTRLSNTSVNEVTSFIICTPYVYEWNAEELRTIVPSEHLCQVLHQCVVTRYNTVLNVCASEPTITYCTMIHVAG